MESMNPSGAIEGVLDCLGQVTRKIVSRMCI